MCGNTQNWLNLNKLFPFKPSKACCLQWLEEHIYSFLSHQKEEFSRCLKSLFRPLFNRLEWLEAESQHLYKGEIEKSPPEWVAAMLSTLLPTHLMGPF